MDTIEKQTHNIVASEEGVMSKLALCLTRFASVKTYAKEIPSDERKSKRTKINHGIMRALAPIEKFSSANEGASTMPTNKSADAISSRMKFVGEDRSVLSGSFTTATMTNSGWAMKSPIAGSYYHGSVQRFLPTPLSYFRTEPFQDDKATVLLVLVGFFLRISVKSDNNHKVHD
ncbi:hypothetical protein P5673_018148 [Acropora cervicornis]|uniref:Uncharacterized protein n=1 Tax=Acropora cervicornis TaxID=6130 RepID=A0AAD9V388_ACRCE|nr:hypothetical protein P5673_018148 [Acropora cervicornis]